ncbi:MAG: PaaI family thioesterase [Lentimicrobiaceae bacterium]|nr:PaaI family thioesterase [Lentimicrobiaceae bacterium]
MKSVEIANPFGEMDNYQCFGCAPDNPFGLQMKFKLEGDEVVSEWNPKEHFQGWNGVLHGGIQATLMDEIASWVVFTILETSGVTSKMQVNLVKPLKIKNGPYTLRAKLIETKNNIASVSVTLADSNNIVCSDAIIDYFYYPVEIAKRRLFYPGIEKFLPEL